MYIYIYICTIYVYVYCIYIYTNVQCASMYNLCICILSGGSSHEGGRRVQQLGTGPWTSSLGAGTRNPQTKKTAGFAGIAADPCLMTYQGLPGAGRNRSPGQQRRKEAAHGS